MHFQGLTSSLLGHSERHSRKSQIYFADEEHEPHSRSPDEQPWHQAHNPQLLLFLFQGPFPFDLQLTHKAQTLPTELKALSSDATQAHSAVGAAREDGKDGGPHSGGVIGQDCLAVATLGTRRPEDTQHTDLKPENHHDSLGQVEHNGNLMQTPEP